MNRTHKEDRTVEIAALGASSLAAGIIGSTLHTLKTTFVADASMPAMEITKALVEGSLPRATLKEVLTTPEIIRHMIIPKAIVITAVCATGIVALSYISKKKKN